MKSKPRDTKSLPLARLWVEYQAQRFKKYQQEVEAYPEQKADMERSLRETARQVGVKDGDMDSFLMRYAEPPAPRLQEATFENFMNWLAFNKHELEADDAVTDLVSTNPDTTTEPLKSAPKSTNDKEEK